MGVLNKLTKEYLVQNKRHTIITIIGIIISISMITAVTMLALSGKKFISDRIKDQTGDAELFISKLDKDKIDFLEKQNLFEKHSYYREEKNFGVLTEKILEEEKKNKGIDETRKILNKKVSFVELGKNISELGFKTIKGKYPEKENEVLISKTLLNIYSNKIKIGDEISVENESEIKKLTDSNLKSDLSKYKKYKVVGIIEDNSISMYGVFKYSKNEIPENANNFIASFNLICKQRATALVEELKDNYNSEGKKDSSISGSEIRLRSETLLPYDVTTKTPIIKAFLIFQFILYTVIALATMLMIYNSFAISISERRRQYGILISVGASPRQIRKMVLFEAFVMSIFGIILGVIVGILGTFVTIQILNYYMKGMTLPGVFAKEPTFTFIIDVLSIIVSIVIGSIIIYISMLIPARKASKTSPIDSIKCIGEVQSNKKIRTSKILKRILGIEFDLANKALKRSKKKYRITIISLTCSIVLYLIISNSGAFTITAGENSLPDLASFRDTSLINNIEIRNPKQNKTLKEYGDKFLEVEEKYKKDFKGTVYLLKSNYYSPIEKMNLSKNVEKKLNNVRDKANIQEEDLKYNIIAGSGEIFDRFLKENGVNELKKGEVLIVKGYARKSLGKLYSFKAYNNVKKVPLYVDRISKETYMQKYMTKDSKKDENKKFKREGTYLTDLKVKKAIDNFNFPYLKDSFCDVLLLTTPETFDDILKLEKSKTNEINKKAKGVINKYVKTNETSKEDKSDLYLNYIDNNIVISNLYKTTAENITKIEEDFESRITKKSETGEYGLINKEEKINETVMNMGVFFKIISSVTGIVKTLVYGFIILIVLLSVSNVINTISTNIILRRREFANLVSMGMTPKQMRKMFNYESILYGIKSAFYGILISYGILKLSEKAFSNAGQLEISLSLKSILVVLISIFIIMFVTMTIMRKFIEKQNLIDIIKKETI